MGGEGDGGGLPCPIKRPHVGPKQWPLDTGGLCMKVKISSNYREVISGIQVVLRQVSLHRGGGVKVGLVEGDLAYARVPGEAAHMHRAYLGIMLVSTSAHLPPPACT